MKIHLRSAVASDRAGVEALLRDNALPLQGLEHAWDHAYVAVGQAGDLMGVAALERHSDEALLRSVAVRPDARGQGVGRKLVANRLVEAQSLGLSRVFLLTTTAAEWFQSLDFRLCSRRDVPEALQNSAELSGACPDSATVMVRVLGTR